MVNISEVIGDYRSFLGRVFENLKGLGIDVSEFELDHIAYRIDSREGYKVMKEKLESYGILVAENIIRGRPISVFKLNRPIAYRDFSIPCVELLAPAEDHNYPNGLEHVEFVINTSLNAFSQKHGDINLITKALGRKVNPELVLKFDECVVKFHIRNLIEAAEITKRTGEL